MRPLKDKLRDIPRYETAAKYDIYSHRNHTRIADGCYLDYFDDLGWAITNSIRVPVVIE